MICRAVCEKNCPASNLYASRIALARVRLHIAMVVSTRLNVHSFNSSDFVSVRVLRWVDWAFEINLMIEIPYGLFAFDDEESYKLIRDASESAETVRRTPVYILMTPM